MSRYVELDLEEALYEKLDELATEEGVSVEDLIVDILTDEVDLDDEDEEDTEYEDDMGIEDYDN